MTQTDRQTDTHTHRHGDSMTESAQWGQVSEKGTTVQSGAKRAQYVFSFYSIAIFFGILY